MHGEAPVRAARAKFEQAIERRITERTWRRVRRLRVEVKGDRVVIRGQTRTYYAKQLAILAALEALAGAGRPAVVDMRIRVKALSGHSR